MKKKLIFAAFCLFGSVMMTSAVLGADIRLVVDNKEVVSSVSPVIENGRTLVPLRAIGEALRCSVDWEGDIKAVELEKGGRKVWLKIDSSAVIVSGTENRSFEIDTPAKIIGGVTMVPIRAVSEIFGADVGWDPVSKTVSVTSNATSALSGTVSSGSQTAAGTAQPNEISLEAARSIALADAGVTSSGTDFIREKTDYDDGIPTYDFEFVNGGSKYDYEINRRDGSIVKSEKEAISGGIVQAGTTTQAGTATPATGEITEERAKEIALEAFGLSGTDVSYIKAEKDYERNGLEYDIEFYQGGYEYSCSVDAATGNVIDKEKERN